MPVSAILEYALAVIQYIPKAIALGKSIVDWVNEQSAIIKRMVDEGRDPTPEEWDALNAVIEAKHEQIQASE